MKLVLQLLAFMTVTTVIYLAVTHPRGVTGALGAVTGLITGIQKTAQGR
jgi:hypothetical protein